MVVPPNGWFIMEHTNLKWMIYGCSTPISGNLHVINNLRMIHTSTLQVSSSIYENWLLPHENRYLSLVIPW